MKHQKIIYKFCLIVIIFISFLFACSPRSSYTIRSFLLDGVPNPYEEVVDLSQDSIILAQTDSIENIIVAVPELKYYAHFPYKEKRCDECHDQNRMGKLTLPKQDLCFSCHDEYKEQYSSMHGPVVSGNCTQCHSPHKSENRSLLLDDGQALCFGCHEPKSITVNPIHQSIEDTSCLTCHNPHGGESKTFLKSKACYQCHNNYEDQFSFLHGPVAAGGLCSACHEGHDSKRSGLLVFSGNDLCLNCHESNEVYNNIAHKNTRKQDCTHCHNPHGSNKEYMLTDTIKE